MKVSVVILNYKVADLVFKCIKSLSKSSQKPDQIIVVDNDSKDGIGAKLDKEIIFIQTGKNLGYTGGNNVGIKEAQKYNPEFIFILNPDTTVGETAIENLYKKAKEYGAGIYGPKIYFDDKKTIWFAGGKFDQLNVLGNHIGVDEEDKGSYDEDKAVDYVTGAAMFVASEVIEKIGFFDERYFLYYEDSDLCYRAKKAGYKIMYIHDALIYHANAKSTGLGSPLQDYYITRNRMLYAAKFLGLRTQVALFREAIRNLNNKSRRQALFNSLLGQYGERN